MNIETFEALVMSAIESLPRHFLDRMDNLDIVIEDEPSQRQLAEANMNPSDSMYGLYEGVALTEEGNGGSIWPNKITIFRRPLESDFTCPEELEEEVRKTVIHEIAHHFGILDDRLEEFGI